MFPPTKQAEAGVQDSRLFTFPGRSALGFVQKGGGGLEQPPLPVLEGYLPVKRESVAHLFLPVFPQHPFHNSSLPNGLVFMQGLQFLEGFQVILGGLTSFPFHDLNPS